MDGTTKRYAQQEPTEAAARRSLQDLVGADGSRTVWDTTCRQVGVAPPVSDLFSLLRVAEGLATADDPLVRVAGRSMVIRIGSFRALTQAGLQ